MPRFCVCDAFLSMSYGGLESCRLSILLIDLFWYMEMPGILSSRSGCLIYSQSKPLLGMSEAQSCLFFPIQGTCCLFVGMVVTLSLLTPSGSKQQEFSFGHSKGFKLPKDLYQGALFLIAHGDGQHLCIQLPTCMETTCFLGLLPAHFREVHLHEARASATMRHAQQDTPVSETSADALSPHLQLSLLLSSV